MSDRDFPTMTDGLRAVRKPTVRCYNLLSGGSARRYHFVSDDIKGSSLSIDHILEGAGAHLGGFVGSGMYSGTLNIQLDRADDPVPQAAHVVSITKKRSAVDVETFYVVTEDGAPNEVNNVVRAALAVKRIVNPVLTGLLSEDLGDTKQASYSKAAMGTTETIDVGGKNLRTGSTVTYAATQSDGSALPAGIAISSSTGVITITKADVAEGTVTIEVTCQDLKSTLPTDHPARTRTGIATLILTIAA